VGRRESAKEIHRKDRKEREEKTKEWLPVILDVRVPTLLSLFFLLGFLG
jgi:hypothetical protein